MRRHSRPILASLMAFSLLNILPAPPVYAAGIFVNSLADEIKLANGQCTLREAIQNANLNNDSSGGDCAAGTRGNELITFSVSGYIILNRTLPTISDPLTIIGPYNGVGVTVNGNGKVGAFTVNTSSLTLQNINIVNTLNVQGGAINNNRGAITIENGVFSFNKASGNGGAIFNSNGVVVISNSTFTDNSAPLNGGAVHILNGTATISNSTFANNDAPFGGGGVSVISGSAVLTNNTFYGNKAQVGGAAIHGGIGNIVARNNIVAESLGRNCLGVFSPATLANIDTDRSCGAGFLTTTISELRLAPLANNGGRTPTFALMSGSAAINSGDAASCASTLINNFDQRGAKRTHICDIGAFESVYASTTTTLTASANPSTAGEEITFTALVKMPNSTPNTNNVPSGTVIFRDDSTFLGVAMLNAGQATFTTSALANGSHAIVAMYEGDSEYTSSVSTTLPHIVNAGNISITVVSAVNPSPVRHAATFIAIVDKNSGNPLSGTITFKNGEGVIAGCEKVVLKITTAICVTVSLAAGTHHISASYSGDANFNASTSSPIVHTVNTTSN